MSDLSLPVDALTRTLTIVNKRGLHARASSKFVKALAPFECEVVVSKDGQSVGGLSIMGLMMLGAAQGTTIHVAVHGKDAHAALEALTVLVMTRFGEDE
jgi:phosphocarrier protein